MAVAQPVPDHASASVRGMRAVGFWPEPRDDRKPGDPKGYEVVLAPRLDPAKWIRFPAGSWQLPAEGAYWALLEGSFQVSPWPVHLNWSLEPFDGRGFAISQRVVPAGRVRVTTPCPVEACTAWLLHENSNIQTPVPWFTSELLRHLALPKAAEAGVLMPGGRIAVALYDSATKNFLGLQAPVAVTASKVIEVRPEAPKANRASLIVDLVRPAAVLQRPDDDIGVALIAADETRMPPALIARTHRKVIAIWQDVPAGPARLELRSKTVRLPEQELRLRPGKVEQVTRDLAPLPKLGIILDIPDALPAAEKQISIVDLSGETEPIQTTVDRETNHVDVTVPAAPLKVTLNAGPWSVEERLDLSDGVDRSVTLRMQVIRVTGRVLYGREGAEAKVTFDTRSEWEKSLEVATDEDGNYEALLARPGVYFVLVNLKGRDAPYGIPGQQIDADTTLDLTLPANRYSFRVTDRVTGKPVSGAIVGVENVADDADRITSKMRMVTGEDGTAATHPLRPGLMRAEVRAEGYAPPPPHEEPVAEGERLITVALEPLRDADALTLLLPNGAPAAGAEVLIGAGSATSSVLRADSSGRVQIPRTASGSLLLVKAANAALHAAQWSGDEQTWTLAPPAPEPLVVRAVRQNGSPTRAAAILWLNGVRLSTSAAAWLTSTPGGTDASGFWIVRGLPARPLEVLLWRSTEENLRLVSNGVLDSMRKTIPYPWPAQVEVKVLE